MAVAYHGWQVGKPSADQDHHIITLKELDKAKNMLKIRDSARPDDQVGDVQLENKVTRHPDKMNLANDMCLYFTC